jgi:hypothetical protein
MNWHHEQRTTWFRRLGAKLGPLAPRWGSTDRTGLLAALLMLTVVGCGAPDEPSDSQSHRQSQDERIVEAYLADHPEIQGNHAHWHVETNRGRADYGEAFLTFHRHVIGQYDTWRLEHGYEPLAPWDPSDPIVAEAHHPGRQTSDPSAVDPLCRTPDWLKLDGDGVRNPDFGAARLTDFTSSDQLGRAIDSLNQPNWHARVHATVGGDLASLHRFPLDPAFWRFHKFIDGIWREWQASTEATSDGQASSSM